MHRVGNVKVSSTLFVTSLAWSSWSVQGDSIIQATLAVTTTDNVVSDIRVQQTFSADAVTPPQLTFSAVNELNRGDKRQISAIQWVDDILVWSKPGSVHLYSDGGDKSQWSGLRSFRLQPVGNWAGANALTPCVGIQRIHNSTLLLTLATLEIHLIHNIHTSPTLAPTTDNIVPTLSARNTFLDYAFGEYYKRNKNRSGELDGQGMTAHTSGWAGVAEGGIAAFAVEVTSFHNLDVTMEGLKLVNICFADLSASLPSDQSADGLAKLEAVLRDPPTLLRVSPHRLLSSHLMKLVSQTPDEASIQQILQLCTSSAVPATQDGASGDSLIHLLYDDSRLNSLRLRYLLARWSARIFTASAAEFENVLEQLQKTISDTVRQILAQNLQAKGGLGTLDAEVLRLWTRGTLSDSDLSTPSGGELAEPEENVQSCPACGSRVDTGADGSTSCGNGHEWSRCSITQQLITHPAYRICSSCTAIALLPLSKALTPVIHQTNGNGSRNRGDEVVQEILESCSICVTCGGRWMRAI